MVNRQRVPMTGPLAPYAVGYRAELARVGYAKSSTRDLLKLMGQLSCWMQGRGVDVGDRRCRRGLPVRDARGGRLVAAHRADP